MHPAYAQLYPPGLCYTKRNMEVFVNMAPLELTAAQYSFARRILGWPRGRRDIAPRLIVVLVLLSLAQVAGRTDYHPVEGLTGASSNSDIEDLPIAASSIYPSAPGAPTAPQHIPQPHLWHHAHCQFAPSLTTILLVPPTLVAVRYCISALRLQQITIIPIPPPPQLLHI